MGVFAVCPAGEARIVSGRGIALEVHLREHIASASKSALPKTKEGEYAYSRPNLQLTHSRRRTRHHD